MAQVACLCKSNHRVLKVLVETLLEKNKIRLAVSRIVCGLKGRQTRESFAVSLSCCFRLLVYKSLFADGIQGKEHNRFGVDRYINSKP